MESFLILGAPLIIVVLSVLVLFLWGAKGSVAPKEGTAPISKKIR